MIVSKSGDKTTVALAGDLDLYTAANLRERLLDLIHDVRPMLVVDLSAVHFADSTGLGTLVAVAQRARRAGGDLVLRSANASLRRSIEVMGLEQVLRIDDGR